MSFLEVVNFIQNKNLPFVFITIQVSSSNSFKTIFKAKAITGNSNIIFTRFSWIITNINSVLVCYQSFQQCPPDLHTFSAYAKDLNKTEIWPGMRLSYCVFKGRSLRNCMAL